MMINYFSCRDLLVSLDIILSLGALRATLQQNCRERFNVLYLSIYLPTRTY